VAAAVYDETGRAVAAISISEPAFQVTKKVIQETLKKEVIETVYQISQRLGSRERRGS
jgi:DNA-binding IclR family transcriptional regulator